MIITHTPDDITLYTGSLGEKYLEIVLLCIKSVDFIDSIDYGLHFSIRDAAKHWKCRN